MSIGKIVLGSHSLKRSAALGLLLTVLAAPAVPAMAVGNQSGQEVVTVNAEPEAGPDAVVEVAPTLEVSPSVEGLFANLAVTAAAGPTPRAGTYTIGTNQLCSSDPDGFITLDTSGGPETYRLTVDLSKTPLGATSVEIPMYSSTACRDDLASVTFLAGNPTTVTDLVISADTFHQTHIGNNVLASVVFPQGLKTLSIGERAFSQVAGLTMTSGSNSNALASVVFPQSLETLTISANAFSQSANSGDNALAGVVFPGGLETLTISDYAFTQTTQFGGNNALASVVFPDSLKTLDIGQHGFSQSTEGGGSNALASVVFPDGLQTLNIADRAFHQFISNGDASNTLASVVFPDSLQTLNIGAGAFRQYIRNGDGSSALASVVFPDSIQTLTIGNGAFDQDIEGGSGSNTLASVVFPAGLTSLTLGDSAFNQNAIGGGSNALSSVVFPAGLTSLTLGKYSFTQSASGSQGNALASVAFPEGLQTLNIGDTAFGQYAAGSGSNALTRVAFPDGLQNLTIGAYAFNQTISGSGSTALTLVVVPGGLQNLTIGDNAFRQTSSSATTVLGIVFDAAVAPGSGPATVSLGSDITPHGAQWFWFGQEATVQAAWGTNLTADYANYYELHGYRTVGFNLNGGALSGETTATGYVYPTEMVGGQNVPNWGLTPGATGTIPTFPLGSYLVDLPAPTQAGMAFQGWCQEDVSTLSACTNLVSTTTNYSVTGTGIVLSALWAQVVTPIVPTMSTVACGVAPEVVLPSVTGVTYQVAADGSNQFLVTATVQDNFMLAAGAETSWTLQADSVPCAAAPATGAGSGDDVAGVTGLAKTGTDFWPMLVIAGFLFLGGIGLVKRQKQRN